MRGFRLRSIVTATVAALAVTAVPAAAGTAHAGDPGAGIKIIGGEVVDPAPSWAAGLYWDDFFGCSATLIAPRWVLTAKHCVGELPTHVLVGDARRGEGTRADVTRAALSPSGDAALLRLAGRVNLAPARLADSDPPIGATSHIYGWGTYEVGEGHPTSPILKRAAVGHEGLGEDAFGGPALQGVWEDGTAGYGDSGGPQVYNNTVVGICSTGDYVRVWYASVATHRSWIRSVAGV